MSLDLDADPGPAGLAEAGAGLSPADGAEEIDLSAPLEALPAQAFSLSDEVRFHPADRSLAADPPFIEKLELKQSFQPPSSPPIKAVGPTL
jgi:hypothetical protein